MATTIDSTAAEAWAAVVGAVACSYLVAANKPPTPTQIVSLVGSALAASVQLSRALDYAMIAESAAATEAAMPHQLGLPPPTAPLPVLAAPDQLDLEQMEAVAAP